MSCYAGRPTRRFGRLGWCAIGVAQPMAGGASVLRLSGYARHPRAAGGLQARLPLRSLPRGGTGLRPQPAGNPPPASALHGMRRQAAETFRNAQVRKVPGLANANSRALAAGWPLHRMRRYVARPLRNAQMRKVPGTKRSVQSQAASQIQAVSRQRKAGAVNRSGTAYGGLEHQLMPLTCAWRWGRT